MVGAHVGIAPDGLAVHVHRRQRVPSLAGPDRRAPRPVRIPRIMRAKQDDATQQRRCAGRQGWEIVR
jgi:hypothetical protein